MEVGISIQKKLSGPESADDRICFPMKMDAGKEAYTISENLNSASHYFVIDLKKNTSDILDLRDINKIFKKSGGNGFEALNISSIICKQVSSMALKILNNKGIEVWKPVGTDITHNIDMYLKKELVSITAKDIITTSGCPKSCGTCKTGCN